MNRLSTIVGALLVAAAVGVVISNFLTRPTRPDASLAPSFHSSSRTPPVRYAVIVPPDAGLASQHSLRQWSAALNSAALSTTARDLVEQLATQDLSENQATKALLCALFREWGSRNIDDAIAFMSVEPRFSEWLEPDRKPIHPLTFCAIVGQSETNPAAAWARLVAVHNQPLFENTMATGFVRGPNELASASEQIFRAFYLASPTESLQVIPRLYDSHDVSLLATALRVSLASIKDPPTRLALFHRFYPDTHGNPEPSQPDPGSTGSFHLVPSPVDVLAGMAEQDPSQAWECLANHKDKYVISPQAEYAAGQFITSWASQQPEQALRFIEDHNNEELTITLIVSYVDQIAPLAPERAVNVLASRYFSRFQKLIHPEAFVSILRPSSSPPWPILETDTPAPDRATLIQRATAAVGKADFPADVKESFMRQLQAAGGTGQ
jgi:hypothetical protein